MAVPQASTPRPDRGVADDLGIPEFHPSPGKTTAAAKKDPTDITGDFNVTMHPDRGGLRSPDAIDRPERSRISITSATGVQDLPPELMSQLQAQLIRAGLVSSTYRPTGLLDDDTEHALLELKRTAASSGQSDMDALSQMVEMRARAERGGFGADIGGGRAGGSTALPFDTDRTRTSRSTQRVSSLEAEALANQAYQDALGSNAGPKQKRALRAALQAYAKAHPQISTTRERYDPDTHDLVSSTETTRGGMTSADAGQIAQNQAMEAPDYGEVQAATTYWNALTQALGPAV